jgi:uncharacterized membrane protein YeiH
VFAAIGARTTLQAGAGPAVAVLMGTMTATFGGLIRDVVCNETPLILTREVYATAAAAGAALLVLGDAVGFSEVAATVAGVAAAFAIRAVAIVWGLSLPSYRARRPRQQRERAD